MVACRRQCDLTARNSGRDPVDVLAAKEKGKRVKGDKKQ